MQDVGYPFPVFIPSCDCDILYDYTLRYTARDEEKKYFSAVGLSFYRGLLAVIIGIGTLRTFLRPRERK